MPFLQSSWLWYSFSKKKKNFFELWDDLLLLDWLFLLADLLDILSASLNQLWIFCLNWNKQLSISWNHVYAPSSSFFNCNYWFWVELNTFRILSNCNMLSSMFIWFFVAQRRSSIFFDFRSIFYFNFCRSFSKNEIWYSRPFWVGFFTVFHLPSSSWFIGTKSALPMNATSATLFARSTSTLCYHVALWNLMSASNVESSFMLLTSDISLYDILWNKLSYYSIWTFWGRVVSKNCF